MGAVRGEDSERIFPPSQISGGKILKESGGFKEPKIFSFEEQSHMPLEMQILMPT
jgi:hypothetical protein